MPLQLHILTAPPDAFVQQLLDSLPQEPALSLEVMDLSQPEPDYALLVEKIFSADSVATW